MKYYTIYDSPIGSLTVMSDGVSVTGLSMERQRYLPELEGAMDGGALEIHRDAALWLDRYFGGGRPTPGEIRFSTSGTPFRLAVWEILCRIPYGQTVSYGDIAREMAAKTGVRVMSAQAVGGAVGHNQIGIIIPCHRVIGSDGGLGGFSCGMEKKIFLLRHEGAIK